MPGDIKLKEGDIISVDIGATFEGYVGDSAKTFLVGEVDEEKRRLVEVTRQSFYEGIKFAKESYRLSDISHAIQEYAESAGFSVVRDYVGHGVGKNMHESPQIPNFGKPGKGPRLQPGMVLAIEPMINAGTYNVRVLDNDWTVVTLDGKPSAHYEHTIAITDGEPELLTVL
jgi:methionyl aminopeptidase